MRAIHLNSVNNTVRQTLVKVQLLWSRLLFYFCIFSNVTTAVPSISSTYFNVYLSKVFI